MLFNINDAKKFIIESNAIENIFRDPTDDEVSEFIRFMELKKPLIHDLEHFVSIYQPKAELRIKPFMNVRIGNYMAPFSGPQIKTELQIILSRMTSENAHEIHLDYEKLHPFTDCNGRSGRMLWAWQTQNIRDGFLRPFYYQTLAREKE